VRLGSHPEAPDATIGQPLAARKRTQLATLFQLVLHIRYTMGSVLRTRVAAVKAMRENSTKAATRAKTAAPHLFDERRHPRTS
jgi:hypothetical protein